MFRGTVAHLVYSVPFRGGWCPDIWQNDFDDGESEMAVPSKAPPIPSELKAVLEEAYGATLQKIPAWKVTNGEAHSKCVQKDGGVAIEVKDRGGGLLSLDVGNDGKISNIRYRLSAGGYSHSLDPDREGVQEIILGGLGRFTREVRSNKMADLVEETDEKLTAYHIKKGTPVIRREKLCDWCEANSLPEQQASQTAVSAPTPKLPDKPRTIRVASRVPSP